MSVFSTLTEFSIALAGFSGIVIAIAASDGPVAPLTWFRNLCALAWALAVAFCSVFPELFAVSGAEPASVWIRSSGVVGAASLGLMAFALLAARRLTAEERSRLSSAVWFLALGGNAAVAFVQAANGVGGARSAGACARRRGTSLAPRLRGLPLRPDAGASSGYPGRVASSGSGAAGSGPASVRPKASRGSRGGRRARSFA